MGGGGGSGGGGFFGGSVKPVGDARSETERQRLAAEVNNLLRELLGVVNSRDIDTIKGYLDQIKAALGEALADTVDLVFGGSVAKHTYVDGMSDIDSLLMIDRSYLSDSNPKDLLRLFCDTLSEKLPGAIVDSVSLGTLAATVKFKDGTVVQILPACKEGNSVLIPNEFGDGWRAVKPKEFATQLTNVNQRFNGRLVPTIKLAKSALAQLPKAHQLAGYHVEALAVQVFQGYTGSTSLRDMMVHFFRGAAESVRSPIMDATGQSVHVDAALGAAGSIERARVSDALARVGRKLDTATSLSSWKQALGID